MSAKQLFIASTDWHLKRGNIDEIKLLVKEQCQLANVHHLNEIFCLGDVFDSRISQRLDVLMAFYEILEICREYNIILICIPGNHDKTDYGAENSFLSPYKIHSHVRIIENYTSFKRDKYTFHLIPYFRESDTYVEYLNQVQYEGNDILLSHIAVTGFKNNDGSDVENNLKPDMFNAFLFVFLGHYHNYQRQGNLIHIPSIKQHNFGENDLKGYTMVDYDLNHKVLRSNFKKYITVKINADHQTTEEVKQIAQEHDPNENFVRLMIMGNQAKVNAFDSAYYESQGYTVSTRENFVKIEAEDDVSDFNHYDDASITDFFKVFCEEKNLNYDQGVCYLIHALEN